MRRSLRRALLSGGDASRYPAPGSNLNKNTFMEVVDNIVFIYKSGLADVKDHEVGNEILRQMFKELKF